MSIWRQRVLLCVVWIVSIGGTPPLLSQVQELPPSSSGTGQVKVPEEGPVFGARVVSADIGGVAVTEVVAGSPAAGAGLEPGDVIVAINGHTIRTPADYSAAVDASPMLMRLSVRDVRSGMVHDLQVTLRRVPSADTPPVRPLFGARVRDNGSDGVLILEVLPGSPAHRAGLEADDVILTINGHVLRGEADYAAAVDASPNIMRITARNRTDGRVYALTADLTPRTRFQAGAGPAAAALAQYKAGEQGSRRLVLDLNAVDVSTLVPVSNLTDAPLLGRQANYKWLVPPKGMGSWQRVGQPELPVFTATFKIPFGMEADQVTYHIDPAAIEVWQDVWIAPTSPPAADRIGAQPPTRAFDRQLYATDSWYPQEPVTVGSRFSVRGTQGVHVQVFPFRHNPVRGLLEVARRVQIELTFRPATAAKRNGSRPAWSNRFAKVYGSLVSDLEMPDAIVNDGLTAENEHGCDYLAIVPDDRSDALEPLLESKRKRGLIIRKIIISAPRTYERQVLQSRIQADIRAQYARTPAPTYLLLVGDDQDIPSFHITPHPSDFYANFPEGVRKVATDFYYANVEGGDDDLTPELLVGRLPARNADELQLMVNKILHYERTLPTRETWTPTSWGHVMLAAQYDNVKAKRANGEGICVAQRWFLQTADDVSRFLTERQYPVSTVYMADNAHILHLPHFYRDQSTPVPHDVALSTEASTALRQVHDSWDGRLRLLLHRDHGIHDYGTSTLPGWGSPPLDVDHIESLPAISGPGFHPVVLSINCETGFFDDPDKESFAERMLRSPDGASAVVAASRVSFSGWNDRLVEGMAAAIWQDFRLTFDPSFKRKGSTSELDEQPRLGAILEAGKAHMIRMLPSEHELNRVTCEGFILFGDPEMRLLGVNPEH